MPRRLPFADYTLLILLLLVLTGCTPALVSGVSSPPADDASAAPPSALIYLTPDDNEALQVATTDLSSGETRFLTNAPEGLADYSVSPDGAEVIYAAWNADGGADLWSVAADGGEATLVVSCPDAVCGRLAWSPDATGFVYERHGGAAGANIPVLWQFNPDSGDNEPLFGDAERASASASWSPDGQWFSYFSPATTNTTVAHTSDGRSYDVPNQLGAPLIWDPDGASFRVFEVHQEGALSLAKLVRYDLADGTRQGAIDERKIADLAAVWSPAGDWLAVTRRDWTDKYPSKTQIWLMRGDGAEAHPLLADPEYQYLSPVWSPDGKTLFFQRYSSGQSFIQPEVGAVDLATGEVETVLPSGGQVALLP